MITTIWQWNTNISASSSSKTNMISFKEYFDQMLIWKEKETALSTYQNYRSVYNHFVPILGNCPLADISGPLIDTIFDQLNIKASSRKTYRLILSALFNDAIRQEILEKNPCHNMRKIRQNHFKIDLRLPSRAEIQQYIQKARNERNHFIYKVLLLAVSTGMRLGEILNLTTNDIDFKNHTIEIKGQLTQAGPDMPLKTSKSYRKIFVAKEILREIRKYTLGLYIFTPNRFPFKQISRHTADKYIYRFFKRLDTPEGFTFHSLRHYHATELVRRGIDIKEVSKRLGHASIYITADFYTHWVDDMDMVAADIMGKGWIV